MAGNNPQIEKSINTLRFLSADAVQKANSGHPGLPMGAAALAYTLWTRHLRHNPKNPSWPGRDRFILSGGHGSALLYSLLHLTGYDLSLEDLRNFRQWGSPTPGHPEWKLTPGVETTTGPLGQGFSNGVGMAIAQTHLAAEFNKPGFPLFDSTIYAIVTDGDLMEGVASEAASLAGHLRLGRIVYLYDDNRISIDGSTDLAFTEDRAARFQAYGWQTIVVGDGNDVEAVDAAIRQAKEDPRPSLILCRTIIGYGLPNRQGTSKAHGEPPGEEELLAARKNLNWPEERFYIPDDILLDYRKAVPEGDAREKTWRQLLPAYRAAHPQLAAELGRRLDGRLPDGWETKLPAFPADPKGMATRAASGKVIAALSVPLPELIGGSADLGPSTNVQIPGSPDFQAASPEGRNLRYGVREHAMGALVNGMAIHGGLIPFGATFFVFSDYMRPALRLSALSHIPSIWIFTHDSIGLGEDGATHQPVEQLVSLRAMPGMVILRPADANETAQAWKVALQRRTGPTTLILSRQALPVLDRSVLADAGGVEKGAYILKDFGSSAPALILMASGSEVPLILDAARDLDAEGVGVRVVSFPSWELFDAQPETYRDTVLPPSLRARISVEAGVTMGWRRWVGDAGLTIGLDRYGGSAPGARLFQEFGFTKANILEKARSLLSR
jgi:transketolase